ncbi:hypothetical protein P7K49_030249 [Saguinus oedipus]|uniref:Uncharacterized protein n=1 Tax=Saguinus oedipus TaxID=9490 RepID=A0ABQ9U1M7_SAGOE|nr:hypothetical protein P7K49_030249 [Saguinus oedipus]
MAAEEEEVDSADTGERGASCVSGARPPRGPGSGPAGNTKDSPPAWRQLAASSTCPGKSPEASRRRSTQDRLPCLSRTLAARGGHLDPARRVLQVVVSATPARALPRDPACSYAAGGWCPADPALDCEAREMAGSLCPPPGAASPWPLGYPSRSRRKERRFFGGGLDRGPNSPGEWRAAGGRGCREGGRGRRS